MDEQMDGWTVRQTDGREDGWTNDRLNHAQVAQLVEHRAVMREVVSSTPAGPTIRILKQLSRKCCLCN